VWQDAVLLKQAATLSRWRQANRLRVRDMAFLFAPSWCYRTASHKPSPAATRMTCKHMLALHVPVTCQKHRAP
jgi:hypothetical protein